MPHTSWGGLPYRQVDVFAPEPLGGNGVAVFWSCADVPDRVLQELTRELRQFEAIFLCPAGARHHYRARVFTMEEELDFAGHPVLGAAAVLHEKHGLDELETWHFVLNAGTIPVTTRKKAHSYTATMVQPHARFLEPIAQPAEVERIMRAVNLETADMHPTLPLQVGSTGLPYLIVPITRNLAKARIVAVDLEEMLHAHDARFLYLYDVEGSEGRNWDNRGLVEDIATGSAAGPVGAYLCRHGRHEVGSELRIRQGRYTGRPSEMVVKVLASGEVEVSGDVRMVASGVFD